MNIKKILVAALFGAVAITGTIGSAASAVELTEIPITDIDGVYLGNAQDDKAKTGVTVAIFPKGARVGVDISGGGPASRETPVLLPTTAPTPVNAVVLAGGSAYGLAASDGVIGYLEENGIGFDTGFALVPIVVQSDIYDLSYGSNTIRPDAKMGRAACENAMRRESFSSGSIGAGTGATIGKICGMEQSMKAGLGVYAVQIGELKMAAVVAVNALGDIYDERNGQKIAGLMNKNRDGFVDTLEELYKLAAPTNLFHKNTTIGMIITNGDFTKSELTKLAAMATNAYARSIRPVGTLADGDTVYAASCGTVNSDLNMAGTLAAEVMSETIRRAVLSSKMNDKEYLANCRKL